MLSLRKQGSREPFLLPETQIGPQVQGDAKCVGAKGRDLDRAERQAGGALKTSGSSSLFSRRIIDSKYDLPSLTDKPRDTRGHPVYWKFRMERLFLTIVPHCN